MWLRVDRFSCTTKRLLLSTKILSTLSHHLKISLYYSTYRTAVLCYKYNLNLITDYILVINYQLHFSKMLSVINKIKHLTESWQKSLYNFYTWTPTAQYKKVANSGHTFKDIKDIPLVRTFKITVRYLAYIDSRLVIFRRV